MKKIIDKLINSSISGADVYRYKDATWLIFTDETRWVVEMTDEGTLWYNYKFFNDMMRYVSMDPKEYEGYITGWANDYFFKDVKEMGNSNSIRIQNRGQNLTWRIVKSIKPNVKKIEERGNNHGDEFEWHTRAVINKGIKNTYPDKIPHDYDWSDEFDANKVIGGGVKI